MRFGKLFQFMAIALLSALVLVGCGGGGGAASATQQIETEGEQLAFSTTTMTVPAGQQITVTFRNTSTTQQHNWVLANGGDDVAQQVDEEAAANGGEISVGGNVLAATQILGPGEEGQAQFSAPPAGSYTYLCTIPGHYAAGMKGTLTVQ